MFPIGQSTSPRHLTPAGSQPSSPRATHQGDTPHDSLGSLPPLAKEATATLLQALKKTTVPEGMPELKDTDISRQKKLWQDHPASPDLRQAGYQLAVHNAARGDALNGSQACLLGALVTLRHYESQAKFVASMQEQQEARVGFLSDPNHLVANSAFQEMLILSIPMPSTESGLEDEADDLKDQLSRVQREFKLKD